MHPLSRPDGSRVVKNIATATVKGLPQPVVLVEAGPMQ